MQLDGDTKGRVTGALRRRALLVGGGALAGLAGATYLVRRKLASITELPSFHATPPPPVHDPIADRTTLAVARGRGPAGNVDAVLDKLGGIATVVGEDDVVIVKVSAQWWNQGMTNVAAVRRLVEQVLERPGGFRGEILVFENVHFRLRDGSGLARAWTRPSERNVDVAGWTRLGDLVPHFQAKGALVSFVGLVDGGASSLSGDAWHDPGHEHGVYGGDGRGPIGDGEDRDGYCWDTASCFRLRRSLFDHAQTPLTWPVFSSPRTDVVVDLRHGLFRREGGRRIPITDRRLTWLSLTTANEHSATGFTGACKHTMGVVDMSAGRLGTHPLARGQSSVHYFGHPGAHWRMAGPLADFGRRVRKPDLILTVAEWVGATPPGPPLADDLRLAARAAHHTGTIVAGTDPVAIDAYCARTLLMPLPSPSRLLWNLDDEGSTLTKFLRYYREVAGRGALDPALVQVI